MLCETEKFEGEIKTGHNVTKEIFAQHQMEALNLKNTILEELQAFSSTLTETEARSLLGCFLFTNDDVFKKISVLSGGEKSRVALAKSMCSGANFMLLDEPTNHLDMIAVQVLIDSLIEYDGTFVAISHDRHFVSSIANKIWYIEDYIVKEYPGTYAEYEIWQSQREKKDNTSAENNSGKKDKKEKPIKSVNETQQLEKKASKLEKEIEVLESSKSEIEEKMTDEKVYSNADELAKYSKQLKVLNDTIDTKIMEWEAIVEEIG